jgi:hypothetical protein
MARRAFWVWLIKAFNKYGGDLYPDIFAEFQYVTQ